MSQRGLSASRMFVLSPVFSTSVLAGAFTPWATNTDPTDVPRSRIQDITAAPFTYHTTQGGTMDGKMCTTFPGVWGPRSDTWSSVAQGPTYPLDVTLKYDPDTGTGTLTWRANPVGRPPAKRSSLIEVTLR